MYPGNGEHLKSQTKTFEDTSPLFNPVEKSFSTHDPYFATTKNEYR